MSRCPIHNVELISFCPGCRGAIITLRKSKASRQNGKKGGRPKKAAKGEKA
jgi:hypothetical protein